MLDIGKFETARCNGIDDFLRPSHLLSDQAKMACDALRKFVDNAILPHEDTLDDYWDWTERENDTFIHDIIKTLYVDFGIQKMLFPQELGGLGGGSFTDSYALVEELARGDLGICTEAFMNVWGIMPIAPPTPNEILLKKFAPRVCGDKVFQVCSCVTEPHGGGSIEDFKLKGSQIKTRARLENNEWVINGHKLWASGFREADLYRVVCFVEGKDFPENIAQIYVPADTPGVERSKPYKKMGCSIDTNGDVWFDNVRVPLENRAHEDPTEDLKSLIVNLTPGRLASVAMTLGIMKRAYQLLKQHVDHREIAGIPMKEHGVIVHELGQIAEDILTVEAYLYSVAQRLDLPEVYGSPWEYKNYVLVAAVKKTASDIGVRMVNRALELMGSLGYSREGRLEKLVRDMKITQIWVGGPLLYLTDLARYYFGTETI
jgi:alkylation response protein AidB-like acyl-CoA dehydrogenase